MKRIKNEMEDMIQVKDGGQSLSDVCKSIEAISKRIACDSSSSFVNERKICSLRSYLDLYEEYNNQLMSLGG